MIKIEKLDRGTYFKDAYKITFKYDPLIVAKVKQLSQRRYLPEMRAWEIPAFELPVFSELVGVEKLTADEKILNALNVEQKENKKEQTQERLKNIKPLIDFDFTTTPLPHQIEAFNYGLQRDKFLIGDEQGLGKTKESIDITVARKEEIGKTLIVCGVNSVKYNWEKEVKTHSKENAIIFDGKTTVIRERQIYNWYDSNIFFGIINIESLRKTQIQDALFQGIKDGYIGNVIKLR